MTTQANMEHLAQVRAVHRRAAYERVIGKIAWLEHLRAEADAGLRRPLQSFQVEELEHLRVLRDAIHLEMVEAGQTDAVPRCGAKPAGA